MTRGDVGIVGAVVALLVASVLIAAAPAASECEAVIAGPYGTTTIALAQDATYAVRGEIGQVTICVRDGLVRCTDSSCPDHLCVRSGALAPGKPIVCAPNRVVVTMAHRAEGELDAISR